jgi:hypothetical protein
VAPCGGTASWAIVVSRGRVMRALVSPLLVPLLVALLAMTTPVGSGDAVHQNQLLDPVLPHVHILDGKVVTDQQLAAARVAADAEAAAPRGISLGAGTGAEAAGLGIALGQILPTFALPRAISPELRLSRTGTIPPMEFRDEPLDPPPDRFA